jgi:hypothetical protein
MKILHFRKLIRQFYLVIPLIFFSQGFAQDFQSGRLFLDVRPDTFITRIDTAVNVVSLPHQFLIPRSEKIIQNKFRLFSGVHYQIDALAGKIIFNRKMMPEDSLTVIYQKYPLPLVLEYFHRELRYLQPADSAKRKDETTVKVVQSRIFDDIDTYSSNLDKSGSIVRGIEIGTNRDLTLNSGLNLQLSGFITPQVKVVAALTDESTPIQPEGNTQTLQEVDQVFVKIESPHLGGTLGDFNLAYSNSFFGNLNRRLQGITAYLRFEPFNQQITYATSRGSFNSNQFLGQEGNQGPYQLVGKNGEREIIVLAGTERIYINGQIQIRGENNDYVIDYSLGQIIFTNNRLITGEDRIEVDFEYSNTFQRYGKNFIGLSSFKKQLGKGFSYDVRLFREWDDTNNLLEDSNPLTEEEKDALAEAGNDPLKAATSGVDSVGPGNGVYVKRDTLLKGESFEYFLYRGPGNGDYNVRFSSVGQFNGSYVRERLGIYSFVGPEKGEYLPIRLIPLPGDKKMADVALTYQLGRYFTITGEGALTHFDQNVFSDIDDENNLGNAYTLGANFFNDDMLLFGKSIGLLSWQAKWKKQERDFTPLDRQFQPDFNYKWNLTSTELKSDENSLETNLFYHPSRFLQFKFDGGFIDRGDDIYSRRARGDAAIIDSTLLKTSVYYEWINSRNFRNKTEWRRTGGLLGKQIGRLFPYIKYREEDRQVIQLDSVLTGFFFRQSEVGMKLQQLFRLKWYFFSRVRDDYLYDPDKFKKRLKLSRSFTHTLQGDILDLKTWKGRVAFTYRNKNYEPFFQQLPADSIPKYQPDPNFQDTSWSDRKTHLARIELQYINNSRSIDTRWQYRVASELQALREKVFVFVGENRGNYRFDEDLQEYVPDPQGDFLMLILPTGKFESVTNLNATWQFRFRPRDNSKRGSSLVKALKSISFFSRLRVEELSREPDIWQLYLLNFQKFHNQISTLRGTYSIDQDIYIFERNPNFGITLRSRYRDDLSNEFVDSGFNETRTNWDRSISWRQSIFAKKLSQEIEYQLNSVMRNVASIPSRSRDILGNIFGYILNYRPIYAWQIQTRFELGFQEDKAPLNQLKVRYFEFRPQLNYAIAGRARAQANLSLLEVKTLNNPFNQPLPFEMAKGKREGISYLWNIRFEYFITGNITTTFNFSGRRDSGALRTIYLGQAEVRAFF